jgi:hypothetical protein
VTLNEHPAHLRLMQPLELMTLCQGTFPLCQRTVLLLSVGGEGKCLRQMPTCLDIPAVTMELDWLIYVTTESLTLGIPLCASSQPFVPEWAAVVLQNVRFPTSHAI